MNKTIIKTCLALSFSIFLLNGCKEDEPTDITTYDFQPILSHIAENIITETYIDLHTKTSDLISAVELLQSTPTEVNLEAARHGNNRKDFYMVLLQLMELTLHLIAGRLM